MSQLPLADAVTRFQGNEERVDEFVNKTGTYTTSGGREIETLPNFVARFDAIAEGIGAGLLYATKADAIADISNFPEMSLVDIIADETASGAHTRYRKESSVLVYKFAFDQLRRDLAQTSGAGQVNTVDGLGVQGSLNALYSNAGAAKIKTGSGISVQAALDAKVSIAGLADVGGAASTGTASGLNVEQRLSNVDANLSSVAGGVASSGAATVDPLSVVADTPTSNVADPNVSDISMATITSQKTRLWNSGGTLSAQSATTLGSFAVTRRYNVIPGQQYTISIFGAPQEWGFYFVGSVFIGFYNSDGSFNQQITSGFTNQNGVLPTAGTNTSRSVTFTVPAGCNKVAFNIRNSFDFSNTVPVTDAALQIVINSIMLNTGATALPFAAFSSGAYSPSTALFTPAPVGAINVAIQGDYTYVRTSCQQHATLDVVWRLRQNYAASYFRTLSRNGVVDFYGVRFIPKSTALSSTIAAFNQSTAIQSQGTDESAPEHLNSTFIGGGHGLVGYKVTKAAHGMGNVDVGSIWSDGTTQWVLTYIESVDVLEFTQRYTGTSTKWRFGSGAPGSATFTHVSGATHTGNIAFTSPAAQQFVPVMRNYVRQLMLDGVALTSDGVYEGKTLVLSELYSILNPASQQDYLIANVGAASPDYVNIAIAEQVRAFYEYSWNPWGAMSIRASRSAKQPYSRSAGAPGDYWGGAQAQRVTLTGDSTPGPNSSVWLYVPEVATVSGFALRSIANITANAATVQVPASLCDIPADPASHFCQFGKDAGGVVLSGHLMGLNRTVGLGIPATRATKAGYCMYFSSANKQYMVAIDNLAGDAVAGDVALATVFRAPFLPTDAALTIPGVIVNMDGKAYCYITSHQNLVDKDVAVPASLNGLPIAVVKSSPNVTVKSSYVAAGKIRISVVNNYGDVVLSIG